MSNSIDPTRRDLLQSAAGLVLARLAVGRPAAAVDFTRVAPGPRVPPGKPGEFDFLAGSWRIKHRWAKSGGKEWDEFEGEATCWTIMGGIGSVEELRIPARNFNGMGLRLLDVEKKIWSDFWVNAKSGVLTTPGTIGGFENGVGTFTSEDTDDGKPISIRGVWDRITGTSHRWHQAVSRDGGKTWQETWLMDWTRV